MRIAAPLAGDDEDDDEMLINSCRNTHKHCGDTTPAVRSTRRCVGFLTQKRRIADGRWRRPKGAALLAALLGAASPATATVDWHPIAELGDAAESFLLNHLDASDSRIAVKAAPLDPRLQLPRCDAALEAFLQHGTEISGRTTVGVRCEGSRPWKVYVAVNVVVSESVVVASRTLPRGHVLTKDDVTLAERDVTALRSGYVSAQSPVIGRRLKQSLMEGRVLTPTMLSVDIAVHRGQSVTLTVRSKSLNIRMEGTALMDGSVNERIRVENNVSRRVVEGIVRSPEHVEVLVF